VLAAEGGLRLQKAYWKKFAREDLTLANEHLAEVDPIWQVLVLRVSATVLPDLGEPDEALRVAKAALVTAANFEMGHEQDALTERIGAIEDPSAPSATTVVEFRDDTAGEPEQPVANSGESRTTG
jgi:hypothetical protein